MAIDLKVIYLKYYWIVSYTKISLMSYQPVMDYF